MAPFLERARLGGGYWQRASVDAIGLVAAALGLIAYASALKRFRPHHWWSALLILVLIALFFVMLAESFQHVGNKVGPRLNQLE